MEALRVAEYIVTYCYNTGSPVTNLQLQKMLYFLWIDYYKKYKKDLFSDTFYAWNLGPVVFSVYKEYCVYGGMPIRPVFETDEFFGDKDEEAEFNKMIDQYKNIPGLSLVRKSHDPNGAWIVFYNKNNKWAEIPFEAIREREK